MFAVIPCDKAALLGQEGIDLYPGLQQWWSQATELWEANRANDGMSLSERLDYQSTLSKQLPISPLRVVYNLRECTSAPPNSAIAGRLLPMGCIGLPSD